MFLRFCSTAVVWCLFLLYGGRWTDATNAKEPRTPWNECHFRLYGASLRLSPVPLVVGSEEIYLFQSLPQAQDSTLLFRQERTESTTLRRFFPLAPLEHLTVAPPPSDRPSFSSSSSSPPPPSYRNDPLNVVLCRVSEHVMQESLGVSFSEGDLKSAIHPREGDAVEKDEVYLLAATAGAAEDCEYVQYKAFRNALAPIRESEGEDREFLFVPLRTSMAVPQKEKDAKTHPVMFKKISPTVKFMKLLEDVFYLMNVQPLVLATEGYCSSETESETETETETESESRYSFSERSSSYEDISVEKRALDSIRNRPFFLKLNDCYLYLAKTTADDVSFSFQQRCIDINPLTFQKTIEKGLAQFQRLRYQNSNHLEHIVLYQRNANRKKDEDMHRVYLSPLSKVPDQAALRAYQGKLPGHHRAVYDKELNGFVFVKDLQRITSSFPRKVYVPLNSYVQRNNKPQTLFKLLNANQWDSHYLLPINPFSKSALHFEEVPLKKQKKEQSTIDRMAFQQTIQPKGVGLGISSLTKILHDIEKNQRERSTEVNAIMNAMIMAEK